MSKPDDYGRYYYCIKVIDTLSPDGEIYAFADEITVEDGALFLWKTDKRKLNLIIARGHWSVVYAASVIDGNAVAVQHWQGEVDRSED